MTDEIPYLKIRAVRDETGASHEACRQALQESHGDVGAAAALWFARRRGLSASPPSEQDPHHHDGTSS